MADDEASALFIVDSGGNSVMATDVAAALMTIGPTSCGSPVVDRLLHPSTPPRRAVAPASPAFDATRQAVPHVEFRTDAVVPTDGEPPAQRFETSDLAVARHFGQRGLRSVLADLPNGSATPLCRHHVRNPMEVR